MKNLIAGLDEVGRGALAGPMIVAVTLFDNEIMPPQLIGLTDSKKMSRSKREKVAPLIIESCGGFGIGWVSAEEIDELGMTKSWNIACHRALEHCPGFRTLLVDGNQRIAGIAGHQETIVGGDAARWQISAASVVAKVFRDREMQDLNPDFCNGVYGWDVNSGYGTKSHYAAIKEHGLTYQHRRLFVRRVV